MRNSELPFKHLWRVVLLALPVLLLLGLNGRTVTVVRPAAPGSTVVNAPARSTVIKQRVMLEAASPLHHYVAPAALGWLPATLPVAWLPQLVRRAVAAAPMGAPAAFVAQLCRQRVLGTVLRAQAP